MARTIQYEGQQVDADALLRALDRADCEESLYKFLQYAWRYIDPSGFTPGWPLEAIAEHLQAVCDGEIRRLLINLPPRCSKSSLVSVCFPAWVWAQPMMTATSGPGVPFLCGSYAEKLALRDSVKCRRLIESPWYQSLWGERFKLTSDQNTKSRFENDKNGTRLITSVDSAITGEGGNCLIAGTMISTPNGKLRIEDVAVGDAVFAFDHLRGKVVTSKIVATAKRRSRDIREIHSISGHRFRCTGDHPIYIAGRGYIPASQVGRRDRVFVGERPSDLSERHLRLLRRADKEAPIRSAQGAKAGQSRCVLLQEALLSPSRDKEQPWLQDLRWSRRVQSLKVLWQGVRARGEQAAATRLLQPMWRSIRKIECGIEILFAFLCGQGSFGQDERGREFAIQSQGGYLLRSARANDAGDKEARSKSLHGVRRERKEGEWSEGPQEVIPSHASHRRQPEAYLPGEPDHAVPVVSQSSPCWSIGEIESVIVDCSEEVDVYDIQVEGQSNFFAEGILVHNCIILDDPNSAQEVLSEASIAATIEWWDGAVSTRLNDPKTGAFIVIQQRLGEEDLTGYILETNADGWTHLCLPMRYEPERSFVTSIGWKDPRSEPGDLLWPERFGEPEVKELEARLGPFRAAGQLAQRPEPPGGGIIKRDWWKLWDSAVYPPMDYIVASLDTAYTTKDENDFSAMTVWGVFSGESTAQSAKSSVGGSVVRTYSQTPPRVMLMYAWKERLELHDLVTKVTDTCKRMRVDKLVIENKAAGHSVAQEIRRLFGNENFMVQLLDPKGTDKTARLYSVQHLFAEGMILAPDKQWAEMVISEVGTFPRGKHDDLVDTVSMALRHLREIGLLQRAPEVQAAVESSLQYQGRPPAPLYGVP